MGRLEQYYIPEEFDKMFNIENRTPFFYDNQEVATSAYK